MLHIPPQLSYNYTHTPTHSIESYRTHITYTLPPSFSTYLTCVDLLQVLHTDEMTGE